MAYQPTTWNNNESPINADNLNKIEQGIKEAHDNIDNLTKEYNNLVGKILWTNPDPTSEFSAQTITLSSDDYDILEIFFKNAYDSDYIYSQKIAKGKNTYLQCNHVAGTRTIYHRYRQMTYIDNLNYSFTTGTQQSTYASSIEDSSLYVIPIYIVGYKTDLFNKEVSNE